MQHVASATIDFDIVKFKTIKKNFGKFPFFFIREGFVLSNLLNKRLAGRLKRLVSR